MLRGAFYMSTRRGRRLGENLVFGRSVLQQTGVQRVRGDQCKFGQVSEAGNPIRKATGLMSNASCLLEVLNRRCFGRRGFCTRELGVRHQDCIGKTARPAAIYSDEMCEAILAGMKAQLKADRRMRDGEVEFTVPWTTATTRLLRC